MVFLYVLLSEALLKYNFKSITFVAWQFPGKESSPMQATDSKHLRERTCTLNLFFFKWGGTCLLSFLSTLFSQLSVSCLRMQHAVLSFRVWATGEWVGQSPLGQTWMWREIWKLFGTLSCLLSPAPHNWMLFSTCDKLDKGVLSNL